MWDVRKHLRRAWVEVIFFSILINLFLLVPSIYMMQVYDRVLPSASIPTLVYLSLIALGALIFLATLDAVRAVYCQRVALSLDKHFGEDAFIASISSPKAAMGDIQPLRDLATTRSFVASKGLANLIDLPFAPIFAVILYCIHPVLCLVTVAGAAVMILMVVASHYATRSAAGKAQEAAVAANLLAQAFTRNRETVQGMGMIGHVTERWGRRFADAANLQDGASAINAIFAGSSRTLRMVLQLAILGTGAVLVLQGQMTAGMIFASSTISGRALQPIDQLVAGWRQIVDARKAWKRLGSVIASGKGHRADRLILPEPEGRLTVKNLFWAPTHARADTSAAIIKDVSFDLKPGHVLAILGPSGSGKSSLARLLAGVAEPTGGTIALDGADYPTWDRKQLGGYIGYLAQDVQLLPGSIAENIARFDAGVSDANITEAASRAQAHALITGLKQGYQTTMEAAGGSLSGGTRQRIGLARAFFGNPKLLILDEPNSNLDAEGEAALERALLQAKAGGTTVIIVTHRPAIVLKCDKALVLRNGAVDAFGPASEILQRLSGAKPRPVNANRVSVRNKSETADAPENRDAGLVESTA
ncbi:type I secretion system permease/ATPase (plasmid) [Rhizobium leguminosarum]|uniref:Type I secretion system permease/ATPase n=2 Tax=Rhizobium leguminosarum TaxID=384 RepID=A0A7M3DI83_RHILE|nr:type I secretion system permease/ATPase [Rhizobium leguminosarum]MDH6662142.1 PrtD family type I secretion system ABC transporter [Rhizobium sophorae]AVC46853.1 type I secretion system ATPase family protein [Rhizobium leguminosarum bv. viciae]MBB4524982.1 PrtD family type I secretion system ABC transporter [Rhizobium leguminosarum]MBY5468261.1 type I secretion system permease/ATPase [Rhizobium leguminosarum]MBY5531529.1 type I secretion system permease/ATPase [Rhizobium leguminosarum]